MLFSPASRILVVLALALGIAAAEPVYLVSPIIPPVGWPSVVAHGLNNAGQVVGSIWDGSGFRQAFIGTTSGSSLIPLPEGWVYAEGIGINDSGEVAGLKSALGFIGTTSGSTAVPLPEGAYGAQVWGINNTGQVVGEALGSTWQAFVGTTTSATFIPVPSDWAFAWGYGINDLGQVTGSAGIGGTPQPYIGSLSGSALIPLPSGFTFAYGMDINDAGQVAGFGGWDPDNQWALGYRAFVGTASGSIAIPLIEGWTNMRTGHTPINDAGQVVGGGTGGWIWDPVHGSRALNDLVPAGWDIWEALSINDLGQILVRGANLETGESGCGYFILDPANQAVPEPGTYLLLGGGLILLLGAARRRKE